MTKRILSLDILRGITVAGMILVNNGYGDSFSTLCHSKWNGLTPCDLVFPFFLFIMGVSTYLSLSKSQFKASGPVVMKIVRRTLVLFLIGLFINWFELATKGDILCFDHIRIWGVMQRIAICYCIVSIIALKINHKWIIPIVLTLLVAYAAILLFGNGYAEDATNILARVDNFIFGADHLYHKSPVDPEGLLSTIPSVAHVLIGFYVGKKMQKADTVGYKAFNVLLIASILIIAGFLLTFGFPPNKRIWSPSYVLLTCGLAAALLGILMFFIDMRKSRRWYAFFHVFGVNPLFLYVTSEILSITLKRIGVSEAVFGVINSCVSHPQTASLIYAIYFVMLNYLLGYILFKRKIYIKL